jgi:predicted GNAT family N-acyltransferase
MFKVVTSFDDLLKVYAVRAIVFVEEQHCPYHIEVDEHEHSALHILGEMDGEPIAAARMRFLGKWAKMERIAVRKAQRGMGLGHQLVDFMMHTARERGFTSFKMHAQAHLTDFYAHHGFKTQGDLFQEAGIDHYLMVLEE